ncbi:MAG: HNH endonuclease [Candidatus Omnitrophica bacterium]|nr:HNH endonuclease [Candidatus Omnitrophota bacterium]
MVCSKTLRVKPSHAKKGWGKYCSKKCQAKTQIKGKWVECDYCGKKIWRTPKDFQRSNSKKFFCSRGCHCSWENENRRCEENSPNWKVGQTASRRLLRKCGKSVKCNMCKIADERVLVVHHVDLNRKNNKPENLMWLCRNCHHLIHYT